MNGDSKLERMNERDLLITTVTEVRDLKERLFDQHSGWLPAMSKEIKEQANTDAALNGRVARLEARIGILWKLTLIILGSGIVSTGTLGALGKL